MTWLAGFERENLEICGCGKEGGFRKNAKESVGSVARSWKGWSVRACWTCFRCRGASWAGGSEGKPIPDQMSDSVKNEHGYCKWWTILGLGMITHLLERGIAQPGDGSSCRDRFRAGGREEHSESGRSKFGSGELDS